MKVWLSLVLGLRMIGIKRIGGILEDKGIDNADKVVAVVLNDDNCREYYGYM